jgi:hypothetical protein
MAPFCPRPARSRRTAVVASVVVGLCAASCASRPATQLVLRIRTDIPAPAELQTIRVHVVRQGGAVILDNRRYVLGMAAGAVTLPGEIGIIPRDPNDARAVDVSVIAEMRDAVNTFTR